MQALPETSPGQPASTILKRLRAGRWLVLSCLAALVLFSPHWPGIPLPVLPLLAILLTAAVLNILHARLSGTPGKDEVFRELLIDLLTLGGILFLTGGATNPLVSLLLPSVAFAALTLPASRVILIGLGAVLIYSLLMVFYLPLPIEDAEQATRWHLTGMWLTFAVSVAMIGWLIVHIMALVRERDAALAAAREQALRDERVTAIGTLAAGAAHELGTPLATMALVAGELAHDASLSAENRADVALLRQQIGICKDILTGLTRRAGAERLENARPEAADHWLDALRHRWQSLRPQAASRLIMARPGPAPALIADPRLEQAVINLLNNSANASVDPVDITLDWDESSVVIEIRDQGPGFPEIVLQQAGACDLPPHDLGSGVGLMLTRSAIEQLGGQLALMNPDDGGALARITLPRKTA